MTEVPLGELFENEEMAQFVIGTPRGIIVC
jgi:hypothetical protein